MAKIAGYFQKYNAGERAGKVLGMDISHHNGATWDFNKAYANGIRFCFHRVSALGTSGNKFVDSQWNSARAAAIRAAGIKLGCYHFFDPTYGFDNNKAGAESHATFFYNSIVAALGSSDVGDLIPVIDYEDFDNLGNIGTFVTNDSAVEWLLAFNNKFKALSGRNCMLYSAYFVVDPLSTTPNGELVHSTEGGIGRYMPLWNASLVDGAFGSESYPHYNDTAYGDFKDELWTVWQYTHSGNTATYGGNTGNNLDLDILEADLDSIMPPPQVTGLTATQPGGAEIVLNWDAVTHTDLVGYKIYRIDPHPTLTTYRTQIATVPAGTETFSLPGVKAGKQYQFQVAAYDHWDTGARSNIASITPGTSDPLTYDELKKATGELTTLYETSTPAPDCYGVVAGNFDGAGISFGFIQFNFGSNTLQPLLNNLITNHEAVVKTAFEFSTNPAYYNELVTVVTTYSKAQQIAWGDSISVPTNKHLLKQPWRRFFNALGITPESQAAQIEQAEWYWYSALNWYNEYKGYVETYLPGFTIKTRKAYALFFDIAVQNGSIPTSVRDLIIADIQAINTDGKTQLEVETEVLVRIANRRADAVNPSWSEVVRERKLAIANGSGFVYSGTLYMDTETYNAGTLEAFPSPPTQDDYEEKDPGYFRYVTELGRNESGKLTAITVNSTNYPVDYATMYKNGGRIVLHRCSQRLSFKDTQFTLDNITAARNAGLKVGFYHLGQPSHTDHGGNGYTTTAAENEANWFCDKIEEVMGVGDYGDVFPVLQMFDLSAAFPDNDTAYDWIEAFVNTVKARTNRQVMLYTAYFWVDGNITGASDLVHSVKGGISQVCPLWFAANAPDLYAESYPDYNFTDFGAYDGEWDLWQYQQSPNPVPLGATYGLNTTDATVSITRTNDFIELAPPSQIQNLKAVPGNAVVDLYWDIGDGDVLSYNIYQNDVLIDNVPREVTEYRVTGLLNETPYNFKITGVDAWEEGTASQTVQATPTGGFIEEIVQEAEAGQTGAVIYFTPSAEGNLFDNNGRTVIYIKNNSPDTRTVGIDSLNDCDQSGDHNLTIKIEAGKTIAIGNFLPRRFNRPDRKVKVTYDNHTGLQIAVVKFAERI